MSVYETRRKAFIEKMQPESVAIFRSAPELERSPGMELPYRQNSEFYYLTGLEEPEALCLLAPNHEEHHFVLFVRPRNPIMEAWTGKRIGVEGAIDTYGAQAAYTLEQVDEKLPGYLKGMSTLYYNNGCSQAFDVQAIELLKRYHIASAITSLTNPSVIVDDMRLIKDAQELDMMRKAAALSAEAHKEAMKAVRPGMYEYELQAVLEYVFRKHGSRRDAYESIIGSGPNGTILHYNENSRRIEDGDLVMIDAGAEYGYYAADISRTFPANGHFSLEQRAIYEIVLDAELKAIEAIQPGKTLQDIHNVTVEVITRGLMELGILHGEYDKILEEKRYTQFYMHSAGHWLGLDVHDRGPYNVKGKWRELAPGMVLTIEPGIYVTEGIEGVDPKYWNIGIRVEDDVLVTEHGCEVLTTQVPKTIADIEALMNEH